MRENKKPFKVAVYLRIASQGSEPSAQLAMEQQQAYMKQVAESGRYSIAAWFRDYGSGIQYDRPGLCAALEMVKSGQADALMVKDWSRLGRDSFQNEKIIQELRQRNRGVFFADDLRFSGILPSDK